MATRFAEEDFKDKPIFDLLNAYPETEVVRVTYTMTSSLILEWMANEMKVAPGSAVLVRRGVYYDREEKPIMVGEVTFLAEKVELQFEFRKEGKNWGIVKAV